MPFLANFHMKRRSIILKMSKGRRNPIVNFICFIFSFQFYWDIQKTTHMQCIHSDEFGNTQTLVIPASTTVKMLHNTQHLQRSLSFPRVPCWASTRAPHWGAQEARLLHSGLCTHAFLNTPELHRVFLNPKFPIQMCFLSNTGKGKAPNTERNVWLG